MVQAGSAFFAISKATTEGEMHLMKDHLFSAPFIASQHNVDISKE